MLSRLFATEACYTIKETNKNKKSHFAEASYHFHLSYHFVSENWEKLICFSIFFVDANYHFADSNRKKQRNKKICSIHHVSLNAFPSLFYQKL